MSLTEEQKVFRFPKSFKWMMLACAISFFAAVVLFLALPFIEPEGDTIWIVAFGLAVFLPLTVLSIQAYRLRNDYILLDDSSITHVPVTKREVRFEWSEVHRIKERNRLGRLELHDLHSTKVLKLEYQLDNFERLRELILRNTQHLSANYFQDHVFHRTVANQIIYLVMMALFGGGAWLAIAQAEPWAAWVFLGFSTLGLIELLFRDIRTVTMNLDHVSIRYILRERRVHYSQIVGVDLRNTMGGSNPASVFLELTNGKTVELQGLKEGSMSLYRSLKPHWEEARPSEAQPLAELMSQDHFSSSYEKLQEAQKYHVVIILATGIASLIGVFALLFYQKTLSFELFLVLSILDVAVGYGVVLFIIRKGKRLVKTHDLLCKHCGRSLVMDRGKSVLSTGKCRVCGNVVVEVSDE